jgi:cytochrome c biogenesis protein CcmG, thiol:disulfide interchange protein DsbE
MSDVVDASPSEAATPQPGQENPPQAGDDAPPGDDGTPPPPPTARPPSPRRLRSLIIGVVIAGLLAAFLFLVLRPSTTNSGNGTNPGITVGDVAPNFSLPRLGGGKPVNLDALGVDRHRPVILNFFASWCGPCQQETPMLGKAAAAAQAAGSPIQFVGVDVNDPSSNSLTFVHQSGVTYPVGSDLTLKVTSVLYALNGQPNTFFIDSSGHVIGSKLGALNATELAQWMKRLTGGGS